MNNTLESITCDVHFINYLRDICIRLIQILFNNHLHYWLFCGPDAASTPNLRSLQVYCWYVSKGSPWSRLFYHQDCFCVVVDTPTFSPKSAPSSIGLFLLFSEPSTLVHRPKHPIQHQLRLPCDKLGHGDRYHCCKSRIWWTAIQIEAIMEDGIASWIKSSTTLDISQQTRRYWAT